MTSVVVIVNTKLPPVVGVPDKRPEGDSVSPLGIDPLVTVNEYGPIPPFAKSVWLYDAPTVPLGKLEGVSVIEGQLIVSV